MGFFLSAFVLATSLLASSVRAQTVFDCEHALAVLAGEAPSVFGNLIKDRSVHWSANDHVASVLFLQQAIRTIGLRSELYDLSVPAHLNAIQPHAPTSSMPESLQSAVEDYRAHRPKGTFNVPVIDYGSHKIITNIIVRVPGYGPADQRKTIVIGAHYDTTNSHFHGWRGSGDGGKVYVPSRGADDNASGSVGVLKMMALTKAEPLFHDLVFALFDAEELGPYGLLRGSQEFVGGLTRAERKNIARALVIDMIGRPDPSRGAAVNVSASYDKVLSGGVREALVIEELMKKVAPSVRSYVFGRFSPYYISRSDHTSFVDIGVPSILITDILRDGHHQDFYHSEDDRMEFLNMEFFEAVSDAAWAVVRFWATDSGLKR